MIDLETMMDSIIEDQQNNLSMIDTMINAQQQNPRVFIPYDFADTTAQTLKQISESAIKVYRLNEFSLVQSNKKLIIMENAVTMVKKCFEIASSILNSTNYPSIENKFKEVISEGDSFLAGLS